MNRDIQNLIRNSLIAMIAAMAVLILGQLLLPPVIVAFFIPFVVLSYRHGLVRTLPSLGVTGVMLWIIGVDLASVLLACGTALLFAWLTPMAFRKKWPSYRAIFLLTGVMLSVLVIINIVLHRQHAVGLITLLEDTVRAMIANQIEIISNSGVSQIDALNYEYDMLNAMEIMLQLIPSMLFAVSFASALVTYSGAAQVLRFRGYGIIDAGKFNRFRLPNNILIGFGLTLAATWLLGRFGFAYSSILYLNLTTGFGMLFFVQGLAVLDCFLARRFSPVLRVLIPLVLLFFLGLGIAFVIVGMLDIPFKFRDRITYTRGE